jgi:hypothetical protein
VPRGIRGAFVLDVRENRYRSTRWMAGAVLSAAILTLGAGFCLLDDGHERIGHGTAVDICVAMLAMPVAALPFVAWLVAGWAVMAPTLAACSVGGRLPDPPRG